MPDLSDTDKLISQQMKYFAVERVCCSVFGVLSAVAGALIFFFVAHIAGVSLLAAGATFLSWARMQKKLTQRFPAHLHTLCKPQD